MEASKGLAPVAMHETVSMPDSAPVKVQLHTNCSTSRGCEFHWHETLEFDYVQSGAVSLQCGAECTWLYPGDIGFVNWCTPHRGMAFLDGTKHYIIQISETVLSREPAAFDALITYGAYIPSVFRENEMLSSLLNAVIAVCTAEPPGCTLEMRAAALCILAFLLRSAGDTPTFHALNATSLEHLRQVLAFCSCHCHEHSAVTLAAISQRFGISVSYLCRIMRQYTNTTLVAYLNELRCTRAAALIRDGVPLLEAAARLGYSDYNYFARVFRRTMGVSPSAYRPGRE